MYSGAGLQEYYCICAIIGLFKKKQSLGHSKYEEQNAAYRFSQIVQNLLALQDNYSAAATLASLPKLVSNLQVVVRFPSESADYNCTANFSSKWSTRQWQ